MLLPFYLDAFTSGSFLAQTPDTLPLWMQYGVATLFVGAWWIERKDRKDAEERTRQVQQEATERLAVGLEKLFSAIEVLKDARGGP